MIPINVFHPRQEFTDIDILRIECLGQYEREGNTLRQMMYDAGFRIESWKRTEVRNDGRLHMVYVCETIVHQEHPAFN